MRLPARRFVLLALLALSAAITVAPVAAQSVTGKVPVQADRIPASPDLRTRVSLPGHVPTWAVPAADRGSVPDSKQTHLILTLSRSPQLQAAFDQLLADQQNPSSPRYHQWLTPQQIGEQFGPTQHDLDVVSNWLTGQGLHVDAITPSRTYVQVTGSAATISAAFQTALHTFERGSRTLQSATAEPTIPAGLSPLVSFISGLSDVRRHTNFVTAGHIARSLTSLHSTSTAHPDFTLDATTHFVVPADFTVIYDAASTYNAGTIGTGQKAMVLGGSRLLAADLTEWENLSGLAAAAPNYIVPTSATPGEFSDPGITSDDDQDEGTLDYERVHATAYGATVDQIITKGWLDGGTNQDLILYAINSVNDPVLTMSFGACEADATPAEITDQSSVFAQAAMQGISVFASSGDSGAAGCEDHGAAPPARQTASVSYLCSSPYVTCVGGTQFSDTASPSTYWSPNDNPTTNASALRYIPEGAWNEPKGDTTTPYIVAATGGGVSTVIPKPSWQVGLTPADGFRDQPDVSFSSSLHNGYVSCLAHDGASCVPDSSGNYNFTVFGGTSASAPTMAGVAVLLNNKLGSRQGNINPLLYKLAASTPAAFHDATPATSGVATCSTATASTCNNSTPSATALTGGLAGFPLKTGYDEATGLGSLDISAFLAAAAAAPALATTTGDLTANPTTITTSQTVAFKDTVSSATTGTPTGTVQFTSNGANLGSPITLTSGSAITSELSFNTAGTYSIQATYSGDTVFAASTATLSFVVTAPVLPSTSTTITGTATAATSEQPVGFTATVSTTAVVSSGVTSKVAPTPTGTVQFVRTSGGSTATSVGSPVTLTAGMATLPPVDFPIGTFAISAVYSGDTNFGGSTSTSVPLTVTAIPSTTTIPTTAQAVSSAQALTFKATIAPSGSGTGTPTGSVQFKVDGTNRGATVALVNGSATSGALTFTPGSHMVTAFYLGDSTFGPSTSAAATVTSTITPTTIAFTTPPPATIASTATFPVTATVSGLSAAVSTTASVVFKDGITTIATYTPTSSSTTIGATATLGPLSVGTHSITATYTGDTNYATSTTAAVTVTVTGPGTVTLTPASATVTLTAGSSTTDVVNVVSAGFVGTQNLTCAVNFNGAGTANDVPTCAFNPTSVAFTAGGAVTLPSTLTISSVATTTSKAKSGRVAGNRTPNLTTLGGITLASLLLIVLPRRGRRTTKAIRLLASVLFLAATFVTLSGCGGGSTPVTPPIVIPGTTAGSYDITINANSALNQPGNVGFSGTIALTIQ